MTQHASGSWVAASGLMPVANAMRDWCRRAALRFRDDARRQHLPQRRHRSAPTAATMRRGSRRSSREPFGRFAELGADFRIYADARQSRLEDLARGRAGAGRLPDAHRAVLHGRNRLSRAAARRRRAQVELFVIDTTVLLAGQTVYEDALADDASELRPTRREDPDPWVVPKTRSERDMVAWLERSLTESDARWKIVIGHHPLWSSAGSKYEQARVLRRLILPALCRYADLYLAGHDHTLELHFDDCSRALPGKTVKPLPAVVSGAAAKQRALNTAFMRHQLERYPELDDRLGARPGVGLCSPDPDVGRSRDAALRRRRRTTGPGPRTWHTRRGSSGEAGARPRADAAGCGTPALQARAFLDRVDVSYANPAVAPAGAGRSGTMSTTLRSAAEAAAAHGGAGLSRRSGHFVDGQRVAGGPGGQAPRVRPGDRPGARAARARRARRRRRRRSPPRGARCPRGPRRRPCSARACCSGSRR